MGLRKGSGRSRAPRSDCTTHGGSRVTVWRAGTSESGMKQTMCTVIKTHISTDKNRHRSTHARPEQTGISGCAGKEHCRSIQHIIAGKSTFTQAGSSLTSVGLETC